MSAVKGHRQIVLEENATNEALGVAGREARLAVPGYFGTTDPDVVLVRPLVPGYSGPGKHQVLGRVTVAGYGTAPIAVKVVRFPDSGNVEQIEARRRDAGAPARAA